MKDEHIADFMQVYEAALSALETTPHDREAQHKAVLALARMGSLNFAQKEYERLGLHRIRHDEDIMALGARLSKDLYLVTAGKIALEHARDSAAKYEAAFQDTGGYYSGINAATMALMADMPSNIILDRVLKILEQLPETENLSPEDHYFIEATRAECFLLLGDNEKAKDTLNHAIAFDPLNFTAHASTLKQFKLILNKREQNQNWLSHFHPPRPLHYAGHIWKHSREPLNDLTLKISDIIQQHDIGYGYGALAAGADIIIAEALLTEGVELNVFLPASPKSFLEHSVRPFGKAWVPRFQACLAQAHSCTTLPDSKAGVSPSQNILAAQMAMGQAILRSEYLDVSPSQLLINEPKRTGSATALHGQDWERAGLHQLRIEVSKNIKLGKARALKPKELAVLIKKSDDTNIQTVSSFETAISEIINNQKNNMQAVGLDFDLPGAKAELEAMMGQNLDGTILVSEAMAGYAALKHKQDHKLTFAGTIRHISEKRIRTYVLQLLA